MRFTALMVFAAFLLVGCQSEEPNTLPSGYEYTMHVDEPGEPVSPNMVAYLQYQMRSDDSTIYDSRDEPTPQAVQVPDTNTIGRALSFLEEALMLMSTGDSLTVTIPLDTLPNKPPEFQNSSYAYYDIKLVDAKSKEGLQAQADEIGTFVNEVIGQYNAGTLENIQETEEGLKYVIHEEGTGKMPGDGNIVFAHYYGALTDSTMFDNSFRRGNPFAFPLNQGAVIQGWDIGFAQLKQGARATFFIPSELGYGATGSPPTIPGGAELVFYVELVAVADNPNL